MKSNTKVNRLSRWMPASVAVLLIMLGLQGCSSMLPTYQTWSGPSRDRDQVAILHVPDDMRIYAIDGKPLSTGGLSVRSMSPRVSLLPGEHQVAFRYHSVWSKRTNPANADKLPDVVKSPLRQVRFNAKAGGSYHFEFNRPGTEDAAKVFARQDFAPVLKDDQGQTIARSEPYQPPAAGQTATGSAPAASTAGAAATAAAAVITSAPSVPATGAAATVPTPANGGLSTLDALKVLWQKASKEDKKAFLRWAFH